MFVKHGPRSIVAANRELIHSLLGVALEADEDLAREASSAPRGASRTLDMKFSGGASSRPAVPRSDTERFAARQENSQILESF
jgi:hypothetical protein